MRRILFCVLLASVALCVSAQQIQKPEYRPDWMYQIPNPTNSTYLYVVEHGEGNTEREALNQAIARVFQSTANRIGQFVSTDEINRAVQSGTNYDVIGRNMKVPIHKVCDFSVQNSYTSKWTVYVLCQVAKAGNVTPDFDYIHANTACSSRATYNAQMQQYEQSQMNSRKKIIAMSFVPGMAQIKKGSVGKGIGFIASEVALVGGVVVTECLQRYYAQQIAMTHNSTLKQHYAQNANICNITRNVCIAGAATFYAWSLIDGIVAKGDKHIMIGDLAQIRFAPYADYESGGIAAVVNF